jgi:hypothetical protein
MLFTYFQLQGWETHHYPDKHYHNKPLYSKDMAVSVKARRGYLPATFCPKIAHPKVM